MIVSAAILAALVAAAIYVVGLIRAKTVQQEPTAGELMAKLRESHSRGELSDEEFRTIKTKLAARLEQELRGKGETG